MTAPPSSLPTSATIGFDDEHAPVDEWKTKVLAFLHQVGSPRDRTLTFIAVLLLAAWIAWLGSMSFKLERDDPTKSKLRRRRLVKWIMGTMAFTLIATSVTAIPASAISFMRYGELKSLILSDGFRKGCDGLTVDENTFDPSGAVVIKRDAPASDDDAPVTVRRLLGLNAAEAAPTVWSRVSSFVLRLLMPLADASTMLSDDADHAQAVHRTDVSTASLKLLRSAAWASEAGVSTQKLRQFGDAAKISHVPVSREDTPAFVLGLVDLKDRAREICGQFDEKRDIDLFGGDFKGGKAGSSSSNGFMVFTAVEDSVACCIKCVTYQHPANEPACVAWSYDTKSQRCWPKIAQVEVPLPRPGYISMDMHLKFRRTRAPTKLPSAPRSATPTVLPTTKTPTLFPSFDYQWNSAMPSLFPSVSPSVSPTREPVSPAPSQAPTEEDLSGLLLEMSTLAKEAGICECSQSCWESLRDWYVSEGFAGILVGSFGVVFMIYDFTKFASVSRIARKPKPRDLLVLGTFVVINDESYTSVTCRLRAMFVVVTCAVIPAHLLLGFIVVQSFCYQGCYRNDYFRDHRILVGYVGIANVGVLCAMGLAFHLVKHYYENQLEGCHGIWGSEDDPAEEELTKAATEAKLEAQILQGMRSRTQIVADNDRVLNDKRYSVVMEDGIARDLLLPYDRMMEGVRRTAMLYQDPKILSQERCSSQVRVLNMDCIEAAQLLKNEGYFPIVLSFANAEEPLAGLYSGIESQECAIARCSNLSQHLVERKKKRTLAYPIPSVGAIYSPDVFVFRSSCRTGNAWLNKPFFIDVITMPPLVCGARFEPPVLLACWKERIRLLLRHVHAANSTSRRNACLVLGAWGCGYSANPSSIVAEAFRSVLFEEKYGTMLRLVVFAVMDDGSCGKAHNLQGNVNTFWRSMGHLNWIRNGSGQEGSDFN